MIRSERWVSNAKVLPWRRWRTSGIALVAAACSRATDPTPPGPPVFDAPVMIGTPVSTSGWEDSGFVTPDGMTLYFTYLRFDPITFLQTGRIRVAGPLRPGWPTTPPFDTVGAEIYRSELVAGQWTEPTNLGPTINLPQGLEGDQWVSEDGNRILFSDGAPSLPNRPQQALYYAERRNGVWQTPVLASSVGFPFVEFDENPHLTRDEQTLFFESSRPGGYGKQDIWMALYWDDRGNGKGVLWSARQADGTWRSRVVVLPGWYGDPSVTAAGDLYVIGGRASAEGFDADVYVARRDR